MSTFLKTLLEENLQKESGDLKKARKDLKEMRANRDGIRASRNLISNRLSFLKAKLNYQDRDGGGPKSAGIFAEIQYMRKVLNELTQELVMMRIGVRQCTKFVKQQQERVTKIDAEICALPEEEA